MLLQRHAVVMLAAVLGCALPAAGQIPNPTLLALPDGQWSELPGTAMASAGDMEIDCCDYGAPCMLSWGGILAYSGATLDAARQQIVLWGGGHNDYFGNQLLRFELATLTWQLEYSPTSLCLYPSDPTYVFTNGMPVSRHTYDHIGVISHLGVLFSFSGACAEGPLWNGGWSFADVWTYDFDAQAWTDHTAQVTGGDDYGLGLPGNSGEYDPVTRLWFHLTPDGVWAFDLSTLTWTRMTWDGPPGIERASVLDLVRRRIWSYGGSYGGDAALSAYDIASNAFVVVSTVNPPGTRSAAGLTYDAANDDLVLFGGASDSSVWNYDLATATWTEYAVAGGPAGSAVYGRFMYEQTHNLFLLVDSVNSVWVWKNTLGNSPTLFADGFESGDTSAWSHVRGVAELSRIRPDISSLRRGAQGQGAAPVAGVVTSPGK